MFQTARRSWTHKSHPTAIVIIVLVVVLGVACGRARPPETLVHRPPLSYWPGYNINETKTHLGSTHWDEANGHAFDDYLSCGDGAKCGGATQVRIHIAPDNEARLIRVVEAVRRTADSDGGWIIAKIHNMDPTHRFAPFNLGPDSTAYLWAGPTEKGNRVAIYSDPAAGPVKLLATAHKLRWCNRGSYGYSHVHKEAPDKCDNWETIYDLPADLTADTAAKKSSLGFPRSTYLLASNPTRPRPMIAAMQPVGPGFWISCYAGCCEVSGFY